MGGVFNRPKSTGGASLPAGNPYEILQRNAGNVPVFAPFVIESTGDYYVHDATGVDSTSSGSAIKPFKSIQYAISRLDSLGIYNANIKVLGGRYTFGTGQYLHYRGTITFENGAEIDVNKPAGEYLIDNTYFGYNVTIKGVPTLNFAWLNSSNVFTKSQAGFIKITQPGTFDIEFKKINAAYYATGSTPLINIGSYCNLNMSKGEIMFTRLLGNDTTNTAILQLFANSILGGSNINISEVRFNETTIDMSYYSLGTGSSFVKCTFYGNTRNFLGQDYYLKLGAAGDPTRPLAIIDCYFDAVSLKDTGNAAAVIFTEDNVTISFSSNRIGRSKANVYAIRNQRSNIKVAMFNNIGVVPVLGADAGTLVAIDEVNPNQYRYDNSGIMGLVY